MSLREARMLFNESGKMFKIFSLIALYLSVLNLLKDSLAIRDLERGRSGGYVEVICRFIPCCIPNSLRGQANYMFRNGYNVWRPSRTLRSHPRCKSADVLRSTINANLYFQFFAYAQFQATRAVSGLSVPIIVSVAAGSGAILRLCGPEYLGGRGDIGAKIDAEVARTGLSDDEIGRKVRISHHSSKRNYWSCIQRYTTIQKGNSFAFLVFL